MKIFKIILLVLILPFIEMFVINRYITNVIEINILFALAVFLSIKSEDNVLIAVFITGIISDIFINDIIGINALLFVIISFIIFYSKNFVIIASRMAEALMLALSFLCYISIKIVLIHISDSGLYIEFSLGLFIKTLLLNLFFGILLFYIFDWFRLYPMSGSKI